MKDEEENYNLTQELLTTQYSLKRTQCALQESKMEIEKFQEKLQRSHLPSYTPFIHIHKYLEHMKESHEMVGHEMHLVLYVLEDCAYKFEENQALDKFSRENSSCFLERVSSPWKRKMRSPQLDHTLMKNMKP